MGCTKDAQEYKVGGPGGCFKGQALGRGLQVSRDKRVG